MYASFTSYEQLTDHIVTYRFKPEQAVDYIPGQFLELTLAHQDPDSLGDRRWFTLSSSPTEPLIAVTIRFSKMVKHSSFKRALYHLHAGEKVHLSDPMGDFVLPLDPSIPLVWIAGGIGITPFRSMAKWLSDIGEQREIVMFHSIRNKTDALFKDVFDTANIKRSTLLVTSLQATVGLNDKLTTNADLDGALFYISGPETMTSATQKMMQDRDISSQQIITDTFIGY